MKLSTLAAASRASGRRSVATALARVLLFASALLAQPAVAGSVTESGPGTQPAPIHLSAEPDSPQGFGYKSAWFAIRSHESAAVADALRLVERQPANWSSGLQVGNRYQSPPSPVSVFVTPALDGWVFVVGASLPLPAGLSSGSGGRSDDRAFDQLFGALARRFDDVQFFATHRVVGLDGWARARHGSVERIFIIADGTVYENVGRQTPEEAALGFPDLGGLSPSQAEKRLFERAAQADAQAQHMTHAPTRPAGPAQRTLPDESWTIDLAGAWSLDPTRIGERGSARGVGTIGKIGSLP